MLSDPLVVGIAHAAVFAVGYFVANRTLILTVPNGAATIRLVGGFVLGLLLGWLAGGLSAMLAYTLLKPVLQYSVSADSLLLPLIGKSFWIAGMGAGYTAWSIRKQTASTTADPVRVERVSTKPSLADDNLYAKALAEIEENRLEKGTWARSFADAAGDDSKAKALYIKARVGLLSADAVWADTQPPVVATRDNKPETQHSNVRIMDGIQGINPIVKIVAFFVLFVLIGSIVSPGFRVGFWGAETTVKSPVPEERQPDGPAVSSSQKTETEITFAGTLDGVSKQSKIEGFLEGKPSAGPSELRPGEQSIATSTQTSSALASSAIPNAQYSPPPPSKAEMAALKNYELQQQTKSAKENADLNEAADRAVRDFPYLDTPEGAEVLGKIVARRNELIREGTYPALALTRAVNQYAAANAPQASEKRGTDAVPVKNPQTQNTDASGCRWVTPQQWSCK